MPVSKKFKSLTAGELQPANVGALEDELSELWRSAAEDPESEHPVVRASVLTLLAFVDNEETGRETFDLVSHVIAQNPCRAILLDAEPQEQPEGLAAWISGQCHLPPSGARQVCCEQIYVRARGEAVKGLDNVVIPLIIPDLPVYLWWRSSRFVPPSFLDQVLRVTTRVMVDSARFEEPEPDLAILARQVRQSRRQEGMAFSDLNWARLTPCRELIAQSFDSDEALPHLKDLVEVTIEWQQDVEGNRAGQALLLTTWLASRLGWQPVSRISAGTGSSRLIEFRQGDRKIQVKWVAGRSRVGSFAPLKISLKTGRDPSALFSVIESKEEGTVRTRAELPGLAPLERTARVAVMGEVELVNEELKFPGRDRTYEDALELISDLVEV